MDFFSSDLHMGHGKLAGIRGFPDVDAHDSWLVDKINGQATAYTDTLYIVGDFSFHKPQRTAEILQSIYCRKVLVKGNHDHRTKNRMGAELPAVVMKELDEFHHYLEREFRVWTVRGGEPTFDMQQIIMFHFPMMHWRNQDSGSWQLHGHLHGNPSGVPGKIMDVGWDAHQKLLTVDDIAAHMEHLPVRANHHSKEYT